MTPLHSSAIDRLPRPSRRWLPCLTVLLPWGWFLYAGDRGISFGRHWDEPLLLADVRQSVRTRTLLPTGAANYAGAGLVGGHYEYPSALYWVGMAMAVPGVYHAGGLFDPTVAIDTDFVDAELFTIRLRQACLAITSLAVIGTFAIGWRVGGRWPVGLAAAVVMAGSWELNYHARFIAPDGLLMAAGSATLLLSVLTVRRPRLAWVAAVAAGVATGAKYPGGLLCVPVLTAAALAGRRGSLPALLAVQLLAFVVTTPGCLLQPYHVAAWVKFNREHYGSVGHFGHTIRNPWAHAMAMAEYLTLVLPSPFRPVAVATSAAAAVGGVVLCRRDWRSALVLLPFPVLYVGYFADQIVMIVRNLLVVAPVGAVLAGVGWVAIADAVRRATPGRWRAVSTGAVVGVVTAMAVAGGAWQWWAGGHMAERRSRAAQVAAARDHLRDHPALRVYPSEDAAAAVGLPLVPATGTRDVVLSFAQENGGDFWRWPANVPGLSLATFGPFACNFDYYPNWMDDRLVLLDVAAARRVPVGQVERAVRRRDITAADPADDLLAVIDCGGIPSVTGRDGVTITAVDGVAVGCQADVAVPQPDATSIQADNHAVTFELTGLDPGRRYRLGWSWWDWNDGRRSASVWASWAGATVTDRRTPDPARTAQLLGPTPLPAWSLATAPHPHELSRLWPPRPLWRCPSAEPCWAALPPAAYRSGRCRITFRREAGPDVVVTDLWVTRPR